MTDTLFDVLLDVYDRLGELRGGDASGGSTTTCVTTDELFVDLNNDLYNNGTIFLPDDSVYAKITDFAATGSNATFTFDTLPDSLAVADGESFAVALSRFLLVDAIRSVNAVFRKIRVPMDDVSLTTVSGQTEYTIPIAAKGKVKQVWIRQSSTSGDQRYIPNTTWYIRKEGSPAGTETLVFRQEPEAGQTILLMYMGRPANVASYDDNINEYIPFDVLVQKVVVYMLRQEWNRTHDEDIGDSLEEALVDLRNIKRVSKIPRLRRHARTLLGKRSKRSTKYGRWLIQ